MSKQILRAVKKLPQDKYRVDIISPGLCGDVVQRLGHSLGPYLGCNIIDVNPGIGLFSAKLNEVLKPQRHTLVESRNKYYETFLKPLIESDTSSSYTFRDWSEEDRWDLARYEAEGLISSEKKVSSRQGGNGDPRTPTLIVANLTGRPASNAARNRETRNAATFRALWFARRIRSEFRSELRPPVRMLFWMNNAEKQSILPRTVTWRGKLACILEAFCHVEEVASTALHEKKTRREAALDDEGHQRVAALMLKHGITTPSGRKPVEASHDSGSAMNFRSWHQELRDLEEGFQNQTIPQFIGFPPGPIVDKPLGPRGNRNWAEPEVGKVTPEWRRYQQLKVKLKSRNATAERLDRYLQIQQEIDELDLSTYSMDSDKESLEAKVQMMDSKKHEVTSALNSFTENDRREFYFLDDDRRAFRMDPPLLLWDRRTAEPLQLKSDEFYNQADVCLLDFQEREDVKNLPTMTAEQDLYFETLASTLLHSGGQAGFKQLDSIGPGASGALIKHVPSLTDARKGGRRDLNTLRPRTMTPQMFRELAIAWDEWPFKPHPSEIMNQSTQNGLLKDTSRYIPMGMV